MPELGTTALPLVLSWALLMASAAVFGFSKTAIGGAGVPAAALAALALPARASSGAILPLLICGDVVAVLLYRRSANWRLIARLLPWVLVGIGLGVWFLAHVRSNQVVRVSIGVLILVVLATHFALRGRLGDSLTVGDGRPSVGRHLAAAVAGAGVGFATMIANAAGAIMTIYLVLSGVTMLEFLGTGAWFFLIVNVLKLPLSVRLGLVRADSLRIDVALLPGLALGCALGVAVIRRMRPHQFEKVTLAMAAVSAVFLLV